MQVFFFKKNLFFLTCWAHFTGTRFASIGGHEIGEIASLRSRRGDLCGGVAALQRDGRVASRCRAGVRATSGVETFRFLKSVSTTALMHWMSTCLDP